MNLCSSNHAEVCFEERKCPICELIADFEREVDALKDDVARLELELEASK